MKAFALLCALNISDYAITRTLIGRSDTSIELNPVMRHIAESGVDNLLIAKVGVLALMGTGVVLAHTPSEVLLCRLSLRYLNAIMAVVVAWGLWCVA